MEIQLRNVTRNLSQIYIISNTFSHANEFCTLVFQIKDVIRSPRAALLDSFKRRHKEPESDVYAFDHIFTC